MRVKNFKMLQLLYMKFDMTCKESVWFVTDMQNSKTQNVHIT